jgi:hypothetical protein
MHKVLVKWKNHVEKENTARRRNGDNRLVETLQAK